MMKRIIIGLVVTLLGCLGITSSYFEGRYRCNVASGSLTISMNSGQQRCFDYLAIIHQQLQQVTSDMQQANNYITWGTDVAYRTTVQDNLSVQKNDLESQQTQALLAIRDFERSLFNQIKSLLQFYLADQRTGILSSIDRVRIQLDASKKAGNAQLFQQYSTNMETLQVKLFLLDRIQFAHDFEELVPFLKEYLYGGGQL